MKVEIDGPEPDPCCICGTEHGMMTPIPIEHSSIFGLKGRGIPVCARCLVGKAVLLVEAYEQALTRSDKERHEVEPQ